MPALQPPQGVPACDPVTPPPSPTAARANPGVGLRRCPGASDRVKVRVLLGRVQTHWALDAPRPAPNLLPSQRPLLQDVLPLLGTPQPRSPGRSGISSRRVQAVPGWKGLCLMGTVRGPGRMGHLGFPQTPHLSDTPGDLMLLTTAWRDRPWGLCRECGAGGSRPLAGRAKAAAAGGFHTWPHGLLWPGADGGELTGFDTQHTHPGSSSPIPVPWPSPTPAWPSRGPCLSFLCGARAWRPSTHSS